MKKLILLFLSIIFLSVVSFGQTMENCFVSESYILDREVCKDEIRWKDSHIIWFLPKVFNSVKVPAGISINFPKADQKDNFNDFTPDSLTLREILNKVITVQPQYSWKEENGVINVYPLEDYSILGTTIKEFSVENLTKGEAIGKLLETEEFKHYLKSKNFREEDTPIYGWGNPKPKKTFSISLKNVTVREILNEIVRKDGNSTWIYREYDSDNQGIARRIYKLS